jgi:transcriptional regulator with XRE-family HTH domain
MEVKMIHPIKIYCLENRISQKALAKKIGISEDWIHLIATNQKEPSTKLAKKISQLTGIPILQLLYPEDYKDLDLDIKNYQRHNHNQGAA